jgi:hypothetical protein
MALAALDAMFTGNPDGYSRLDRRLPAVRVRQTPHKKDLIEYYKPPRSMTEREQAYYETHKNLNGLY